MEYIDPRERLIAYLQAQEAQPKTNGSHATVDDATWRAGVEAQLADLRREVAVLSEQMSVFQADKTAKRQSIVSALPDIKSIIKLRADLFHNKGSGRSLRNLKLHIWTEDLDAKDGNLQCFVHMGGTHDPSSNKFVRARQIDDPGLYLVGYVGCNNPAYGTMQNREHIAEISPQGQLRLMLGPDCIDLGLPDPNMPASTNPNAPARRWWYPVAA